jgi:MFS family permease
MPPAKLYTPRLLLILFLQFIFGLGYSSFLLLPKYLAEAHGADATSIGRVAAAGPIAAVFIVPLQAAYIDRFRRHRLMLVSAIVLALAALGFTRLHELGWVVYALRLMQGAAFASFMATAVTLVAEITPAERMGQAIGLSGAANLVTNAIGPGLAEPIAARWGWHTVFLLSAIAAALAALGTLALGDARVARSRSGSRAWLVQPRRLALLHSALVAGLGFGVVITFYQPFALALGIGEVRALFIGYTLAALGVRVLCGAWLDRIERRLLVLIAASVYPLVVFATAGLRPGWLFPLGAALGLAQGTLYPVVSALLFEQSEPEARGALMTYFSGCFNLGFVLATVGLGALASQLGYRALFIVASVLTATAVPVLATALGKAPGTA